MSIKELNQDRTNRNNEAKQWYADRNKDNSDTIKFANIDVNNIKKDFSTRIKDFNVETNRDKKNYEKEIARTKEKIDRQRMREELNEWSLGRKQELENIKNERTINIENRIEEKNKDLANRNKEIADYRIEMKTFNDSITEQIKNFGKPVEEIKEEITEKIEESAPIVQSRLNEQGLPTGQVEEIKRLKNLRDEAKLSNPGTISGAKNLLMVDKYQKQIDDIILEGQNALKQQNLPAQKAAYERSQVARQAQDQVVDPAYGDVFKLGDTVEETVVTPTGDEQITETAQLTERVPFQRPNYYSPFGMAFQNLSPNPGLFQSPYSYQTPTTTINAGAPASFGIMNPQNFNFGVQRAPDNMSAIQQLLRQRALRQQRALAQNPTPFPFRGGIMRNFRRF
jgi:hypothetical protein